MRFRAPVLAFLLFLLFFPGAAQAQQTPAAAPLPVYNGDWWLSVSGWEQYGFLSGYEDCYAFEYRGSAAFTKEVQSYIDDLNKYFLADRARRKETVSHALDVLRNAATDASGAAGSAGAASSTHGGLDGRFWFDADPAAELGFVEGYLACHTAKVKDADGKFSKPPAEYVDGINKAYGITDDTDDVDPEKAPIKIADALHKLKDEEAVPGKPGA
ncbi:MAG TPA: hypothetical protein VKG84_01480 [Candidatus Acidoferrales bacterium]|nr:hypothetical protein [Candidatus Acidoferrales bacterium]